jgi:hypothetical protein
VSQEIVIGDKVSVRKAKDVPLSFKGTVEKLYANAAMLTIDSFSPDDASLVEDMKNKTVVNYKHIKKGGKAVIPPAPNVNLVSLN